MLNNRTIVVEQPQFILEEIAGSVRKEYESKAVPFRGYHFQLQIGKCKPQLHFTSPPVKASHLAQNTGASVVINGGFWTNSHEPLDWCILNNQTITPLTNFRRPCIYWKATEIVIGMPEPLTQCDSVLQAGPLLLWHTEIQTDYSDFQEKAEEFDSDITADRHPRTVFGLDPTHYHFLIIDGRSRISAGLYLEEMAQLCAELGMHDAINLDGGASTTCIYQGKLMNHPRFSIIRGSRILSAPMPGRERKVPTFIAVKL